MKEKGRGQNWADPAPGNADPKGSAQLGLPDLTAYLRTIPSPPLLGLKRPHPTALLSLALEKS